jgi:hypothetical protein
LYASHLEIHSLLTISETVSAIVDSHVNILYKPAAKSFVFKYEVPAHTASLAAHLAIHLPNTLVTGSKKASDTTFTHAL